MDSFPRLRGNGRHHINYRHIIDWLLRKPGAFDNYRYQDALFPSIRFRMVYDFLMDKNPASASKEYLRILNLAAKENESRVDDALRLLFEKEAEMSFQTVLEFLESHPMADSLPPATEIQVEEVNLQRYDQLLLTQTSLWDINQSLNASGGGL